MVRRFHALLPAAYLVTLVGYPLFGVAVFLVWIALCVAVGGGVCDDKHAAADDDGELEEEEVGLMEIEVR